MRMMEISVSHVSYMTWSAAVKGKQLAFMSCGQECRTPGVLYLSTLGPCRHLYSWSYSWCLLRFFLLAWWFFVFISMFLWPSLSLYAHLYFLCVCMAKKEREAIFFQKLNILYLIYIPQGHFHFKFNILVILIFGKILANLQGFGSTRHIINV